MERIVKIGMIGCGGIANGKHMPSLSNIPNVQMVAFCDIIEERAIKAKEQYGTPDGHINVTLSKDDKWAILKVSDDGIGIDSQHLDKIWDRFYQVDPSRSSSSAGLGLSMVKEIVKLHHGEISVISQPGEGTEFTVKLPLMV